MQFRIADICLRKRHILNVLFSIPNFVSCNNLYSLKKYYANIYHLTRSKFYILLLQKKLCKCGTQNLVYSWKQTAECKFYCVNSKLVIVTDLYIYERYYRGKNGEIFIN